jgi:hypothetical protein
MNTLTDNDSVALLWTGGWDSTFQLLQLLLGERRRVTPYYVIAPQRPSTGVELWTMKRIKEHLIKEYPHTRELFQPTQYFDFVDILPDAEITEAFESLLKEKYMGSQYDWMARFCKQRGISDMQLCIHQDDKAHEVLEHVVSKNDQEPYPVFRLDPQLSRPSDVTVFCYFTFPIFDLSKIEMSAIADEQGWQPMMNMTWFCHTPTRSMKPCGICNPCLYTIEEGLGWRIPVRSRVSSFVHRSLYAPAKLSAKSMLKKLGWRMSLQQET